MKAYDHPNLAGDWRCPICNTADDKPVTPVMIDGTQSGYTVECRQYHVDCIDLVEMNYGGVRYLMQKVVKRCVS